MIAFVRGEVAAVTLNSAVLEVGGVGLELMCTPGTLATLRVGRTALLLQFAAHPWKLPQDLVLQELRGFKTSTSLDPALNALIHGPRQGGATAGSLKSKMVIGWGRNDRVTVPSEAARATELFPDASLHWFENCGHFPHWDQPTEAARLILDSTT
jgi:pimeloyl-ACP methyl ester carboxylesterase